MQRANRKRKSRPRICGPSANLAHSHFLREEGNCTRLNKMQSN